MKTQITNELIKANINPEGNMIARIEDAISFVNDLGVDFFLENTTFGSKLKDIVFKLSK
tara:strand:- start:446 stop:622 length:177 start_codon:yes stop_codon:yes gene_type:complete